MANALLRPTSINWVSLRGIQLEYDAVDEQTLIGAGLIEPEHMPGAACRSYVRRDHIFVSRRKDGRVNARLDADYVLSRDGSFKRFLGALMADTRLSLVQGEISND
ncbi:hypothetical protein [Paraburkholderia agricolaris]|uniref:hypothetical protein n=1 Tax=Paraburkholderia agricolaris TaxID=2152888 RepID=UPI001292315A|nr:hypothetical protein [Paraburkholderia agricolaris]